MDENLLRNRDSNLNLLDMPTWMNSNKYILSGYRPIKKPLCYYSKSIFRVHNETINIWTHVLGSLTFVFLIELNTFSCAKFGTSYQVLPLLSNTSNTLIILLSLIVLVSNFLDEVKTKSKEFIVADIAFLDFFKR